MENEKEQFFSLENSADSDETSSGENNIAYKPLGVRYSKPEIKVL